MMINPEAVGCRFLKTLTRSDLTKMSVPSHFIANTRSRRDRCNLVSGRGKTWHVDLCINNGDLYMGGGGWRQFRVDNNLDVGALLMFRYKGNQMFRVRIFSPGTGCELSLPRRGQRDRREVKIKEGVDNMDDDSNSDSSIQMYFPLSGGRERRAAEVDVINISSTGDGDGDDTSDGDYAEKYPVVVPRAGRPCRGRGRPRKFEVSSRGRGRGRPKVKVEVLAEGYFEVEISSYHLARSNTLIKARYRRSSGLTAADKYIRVLGASGGEWLLRLFHREANNDMYLNGGWHVFVRENLLMEGDLCIFKLVAEEDWKVFQLEVVR